jgi:hypothetical protein
LCTDIFHEFKVQRAAIRLASSGNACPSSKTPPYLS